MRWVWKDNERVEHKYSEKTPYQCPFFHYKSQKYWSWIEAGSQK